MINKVGENEAAYNPKLKDRSVALDAAETSAMKKLEHVRAMKETWQKLPKEDGKNTQNSKGQSEVPPRPPTPMPQASEEIWALHLEERLGSKNNLHKKSGVRDPRQSVVESGGDTAIGIPVNVQVPRSEL